MNILEKRNIKFVKTVRNGITLKYADTDDWDMIHITGFCKETTIEIIKNIDLAIEGKFKEIDHNGAANKHDDIAFITPEGIEYWDMDAKNKYVFTCSLQDFKELCLQWLKFLK